VNGRVIREPGYAVDPGHDRVLYKKGSVSLKKEYTYVLLNKPGGVVCTVSDDRRRLTVLNIVDAGRRLFPVGRLDITTTGLLVLTDDGELCYRLAHPKYTVNKVYRAVLHKPLGDADRDRLARGVDIGNRKYVRARIRLKSTHSKMVDLTIHEGEYHIVKRLFDMLGYKVTSLDRIGYAGLTKRRLPRGGWRFLKPPEVRKLYKLVGLGDGY